MRVEELILRGKVLNHGGEFFNPLVNILCCQSLLFLLL